MEMRRPMDATGERGEASRASAGGEGAPAVAMAMQVAPQAMEPTAIPLPAALGLMGAGLTALGLLMRRRG